MTLPSVDISKATFTTAQAPASSVGVLAILAASSTGTVNQPGGYARSDLAVTDFGIGPLTDFAAYDLAVANHPVVLVKGAGSYAGSYGAITKTLASGTATVVAGATTPYDRYGVQVNIVAGGTAGGSGITFNYSLDEGNVVSGTQAQPASATMTLPNSGVSFTIGGVLTAGDRFTLFTERPLLNDADITAAMGPLGKTRLPFEGVLIDASAGASTVGLVDTILSGWESNGIFKFALLNSRFKAEPQPTGETESAFATAMTALFGTQTSIRICVGADGGHIPSAISGNNLKRPTSLALAARAMKIPIGEDPAWVERGALTGVQIASGQGNPLDHDEDLYPTLDSLRLTSMRSFAPGGPQGVYITDANTIQPDGGSFPYLQHIRIMNRACEVAWAILTRFLSRGVRKNPKKDPVTGAVYIFEPDASMIEAAVNEALVEPLKGQVSDFRFSLSRTDDMSAVPCKVNAKVSIVALAYIKKFAVTAEYTKTITTSL